MDECEHGFETTYCPGCGAFLGFTCVHCGEWYDGGDPACNDIQDCTCEVYVWPKVNIKVLVGDYYGAKLQSLPFDVMAQIKQAAEWEIRHLLKHKVGDFVEGPAQLVWLDWAGRIKHESVPPGQYRFGVFLAYDIGIYD